ncbi:putative 2-aminoethylphosphonate ABC transporter ATP-binding protein [Curvibacter sp. APW13]|uniref:putative 2-aminoethylphosphonate ABC transporter ATP-binding protein n=1 Tax=Curvibacter sp. APW13 TaxID=3077236 RepID=UPI0028DFDC9B|nr:putative 2-aminoethylphosphonate ABC transporter ATP-binding protein [Curvibacter sp. APW13]MDT8989895.1 putative 2-aminoethylphosphonate ABC transporter ATP-binding protein [Curvibacter sp. APW13]
MAYLQLETITKHFARQRVLSEVSLDIEEGEFVVLLGPSGCGKTTLLRVIAGLEQQSAGRVLLRGRDISALPPAERDYGIVFQSYALFPNLTVAENIGYGIHGAGTERQARAQRVAQMLELVGLPGLEQRYPAQLSGGQQQRVAIARALATAPGLLLLDEPLSALDAIERVRLRTEIQKLQKRLGVTTIMVTHDQEEALAVADRIVVMQGGRIEQCGTPHAIYAQPATEFVAGFVGRMNHIRAMATSAHRANCGNLELPSTRQLRLGEPYRFGVRPEDVQILGATEPDASSHFAKVLKVEYLGPHTVMRLAVRGCDGLELQALLESRELAELSIKEDSMVRIRIPGDRVHSLSESPAREAMGAT